MTVDSGLNGRRSVLAVAIEQENWELAALCLLYGVVKAAEALPVDSVDELIELLALEVDSPDDAGPHRRRGRYRGRRG